MSITTIRPNGTVLDNQVTEVGGSPSHINVDDSPDNDATYLVGAVNHAQSVLSLTDITLTAVQRVKQVRTRIRCFHDATDVGRREYVDVYLRDSKDGKLCTVDTYGTVFNTAQAGTGGWKVAAPGSNVAWTEAIVDRLQVYTLWKASTGGKFLRVTELYVDVDINDQPAIATPVVSGFDVTTRPTVTWVYSDADLDPQTRWRVKIFRQDQLTSLGDAWLQKADWDSGIRTGSNDSTVVGASLVNGTIYTAVVWGGQNWQGPLGDVWWSEPSDVDFTMALTPPATPTMTVAVDSDPPSHWGRIDVTDTNNLLGREEADPDLSGIPSPTPWNSITNGTGVSSGTQFFNGTASWRVTATAGGNVVVAGGSNFYKWSTPGQQHTFGIRARAGTTARNVFVSLRWRTAGGSLISTTDGTAVADSNANWNANPWVTGTAPATTAQVELVITIVAAAAAEIHYLDGFIYLRTGAVAAPVWSPGIDIDQGPYIRVQRWEPVSPSLPGEPRNLFSPNVASCGQFLNNLDGFDTADVDDFMEMQPLPRAMPIAGASDTCIQYEFWSGDVGGLFMSIDPFALDPLETENWLPAIPGEPFTFWIYAWTQSGTFNTRPRINWTDYTDSGISSVDPGVDTVLTTTPQLITYTATAPANAVGSYVNMRNSSLVTNGQLVYFWGPGFARGTVAYPGEQGSLTKQVWNDIRGGYLIPDWFAEVDAQGVSPGEPNRFHDREVAGGRIVYYRARSEIDINGDPDDPSYIVSPYTPWTPIYIPTPGKTILKSVNKPQLNMVLKREPEMTEPQSEQAAILYPLGSTRPVKLRDFLGGNDGKMIINYETHDELRQIRNLTAESAELMVAWHDGGLTYVLVTDRDNNRIRSGWGRYELGYVESERP